MRHVLIPVVLQVELAAVITTSLVFLSRRWLSWWLLDGSCSGLCRWRSWRRLELSGGVHGRRRTKICALIDIAEGSGSVDFNLRLVEPLLALEFDLGAHRSFNA